MINVVTVPMLFCFCVFQRKIRGQELLGKVCDNLNLVEKDYFGLLYEDRGDPRIWIDLEKRVSKMVKRKIDSLSYELNM